MKTCNHYILLLLLSFGALKAQPVVTITGVPDGLSHSTARVTWSLNMAATHHRLRFSENVACAAGTYSGQQPAAQDGTSISTGIQGVWSGGHFGMTMHLCAESSFDNVTWGTSDYSYTVPALPGTHPAPPNAPATFSTAMPSLVGTVALAPVTSCPGDLLTKLTSAVTQQITTNVAVIVPDSIHCGVTNFYPPGAADACYFSTADVNVGTDTITCNSHGYSNGDLMIFSSDERIGPPPLGLQQSFNYYVCNKTANTFQVSLSPGCGVIVSLLDTGHIGQCALDTITRSTHEIFIVAEWPLGTNWRVPEGVQYESLPWSGTAHGKIQLSTAGLGQRLGLWQQCSHDVRIMNESTTGNTTESPATTNDPPPWGRLWEIGFGTFRVGFDRAWNHGQGFPDRIQEGTYQGGHNNFNIYSENDNFDFWLSGAQTLTDLLPHFTSTVITVDPGTFNLGLTNPNFPGTATITATAGAPSGGGVIYVAMNGTLTAVAPTGLTLSCVNITCSTSGSPAFPVNGSGYRAAGRIATFTVTGGAFTALTDLRAASTAFGGGEGPTAILGNCAFGRGPTKVEGSLIEAAGIALHSDDSCTNTQYSNPGTDITINRNCFCIRESWVPTRPSWDGRHRLARNLGEIKKGSVQSWTGNHFRWQWSSITPQGYGFAGFPTKNLPGVTDPQITDWNFQNNYFEHISAGIEIGASVPGTPGLPASLLRVRASNNVIALDSSLYDPALKTGANIYGFPMFSWGGMEDFIRNHNTYVTDGTGAFFSYQINQPFEGLEEKYGLYVIRDLLNRVGFGIELDQSPILPAAPGTFGKPLLDWMATQGAGNPVYSFSPILVPWTDANACTWQTDWAGSGATVQIGANCATSTPAQRVAAVMFTNFAAGSYKLSPSSPYYMSAPDGTDYGANYAVLNAALGVTGTPAVSAITDTTATVTTTTPDTFPCPVIITNDAWVTYSGPFAYGGAPSTTQAVNLTGLLAAGVYDGYVLCAVEHKTFNFTTTGSARGVNLRNVNGRSIGVR